MARGRRLARLAAIGALVLTALAGCSTEDALRFGWPRGISEQAESMRELWTWSVIAALAVGVFVWGLIFWVVLRYRKKGDHLPPQTRYNLPIEVLYTVVPFLIVAVLFYYTAVTQNYVNEESRNPDVRVLVTGFKWNWQFSYPAERDATGEVLVARPTTQQVPILVVPTGKRIRIEETSEDVIHSFWVPELLFKRDVIPGRTNSFEVTIDKAGAYVGRCAELCGTYHANMNFEMRAVDFPTYQRFIAERKAGKSTAEALQAVGQAGVATTTHPFKTKRDARSAS
jgi:cytochrome c oxidase subunit 2